MHYSQFCPIAKATEILGERWTILIIRELLMGGRRFNELQRGLGDISPALLTDQRDWWLLVNGDRVELCITPPGRDVDVYFTTTVCVMHDVWMGDRTMRDALSSDDLIIEGDPALTRSVGRWLRSSVLVDYARTPVPPLAKAA